MDNVEPSEIVEMYNNGMTLKDIGEKFGISKSTAQRLIVKDGYIRSKETGKYEKVVSSETNVLDETTDTSKQLNNVSRETIINEKLVNRTYALSEKIDRAIKIKSAIEGKKAIDIVREALESYIEDKYLNM
jgi:inorganic pyrophosphatase